MDLGLALPHYDHSVPGERPVRWATVAAWARAAEDAGLASVWMSDHLFLDPARWGLPSERSEGVEALTALSALARLTTRVRLGTLVLCPHLRPPAVLAKALATVDVLSAGRLIAGLGAGWFRPEYEEAGLPFPPMVERQDYLAETIEVLRKAFTGEPFDHRGTHLDLEGMVARPRPVQRPAPPLWIGGSSDGLLDVVARHADGWNAGGWRGTVEDFRDRSAALDRACEAVGRDPATVTRSANRLVLIGEDEADVRRRFEALAASPAAGALWGMTLDEYRRERLVGTPEQVGEQLAALAGAGVSHLILTLGAVPFTVTGADAIGLVASASLR